MERAWSLCELGKGGVRVTRPCLTEDAEAQRGEATCLRTHRRAVGLSPPGCARRPPRRAPCLGPTPSWASQDFTSIPTRTRGWGVRGCGADLSCCAWQEASQTLQAEKGAGIRKRINYLEFNSHGSCRGPGGRFCLCLLFHYFLSLGPVASGWRTY